VKDIGTNALFTGILRNCYPESRYLNSKFSLPLLSLTNITATP
jgi:hypothetical protein